MLLYEGQLGFFGSLKIHNGYECIEYIIAQRWWLVLV